MTAFRRISTCRLPCLVAAIATLVLMLGIPSTPAQAAGPTNDPLRPSQHTLQGRLAPHTAQGPHHALTVYHLDSSGFDGSSTASDPTTGLGDDQWTFDFPQIVQVSVTVTDIAIVGDNYTVFVDNIPIGTTPPEPIYGSTYSTGTETANVAPGSHTITIQDVGGLYYYNQGYTVMFPAGFYITISFASTTIVHQIIFVHGIGQDSSLMTPGAKQGFGPLLTTLGSLYDTPVDVFSYVDDRSRAGANHVCPTGIYPPCQSQSHIFDNAVALAAEVSKQYTATGHKVVVIGYSMGAAIIRTLLAGCPDTSTVSASTASIDYARLPLKCPSAHTMIDNVVFINGVQQGSWVMNVEYALQHESSAPGPVGWTASTVNAIISQAAIRLMNLNVLYPAEGDLAPQSANILAHDAQPLPSGIHYFNFYGDIRLHLGASYLFFNLEFPHTFAVGDLVLFPGQDDPSVATSNGGARLCPHCVSRKGYSAVSINATTSYDEWALSQDVTSNFRLTVADLPVLGDPTAPFSQGKQLFQDLSTAPMMHINIPSSSALGSIQVADPTGYSTTATIPTIIAHQLESQDGVIP